jgi:hypothetical protein
MPHCLVNKQKYWSKNKNAEQFKRRKKKKDSANIKSQCKKFKYITKKNSNQLETLNSYNSYMKNNK